MIFHFPTFPDPCWAAVLAGEYITTCRTCPHTIKMPQNYIFIIQKELKINHLGKKNRAINQIRLKERRTKGSYPSTKVFFGNPRDHPDLAGLDFDQCIDGEWPRPLGNRGSKSTGVARDATQRGRHFCFANDSIGHTHSGSRSIMYFLWKNK